MSPRPDVSEERRAQILESAIKVFARQGFANARMDDVAAEAGLSKGLLYWYFKSKDEIVIAIAHLLFGGELRKLQSLSCADLPAGQCLSNFIEMFIADMRLMLKVTPIIYELYALAFRNQVVREVMRAHLRSFVAIVEPILQRGIDSGEFTSGISPHQTALAIGASLEGTLLLWAYDPDSMQVEEQLRLGGAFILKGLKNA
ncbi:MAG: TetR/AcrR family transcriptional regulator [Chloroflexi bacterium]|jgi:AcrR family transcriptional regulator|nr:TetR/AcrR family transcriptional regulator [Anaerolineaceae bacterium]NMB89637.1 TetR/AcrR family transcriptional regulator [Chloroflexota bacterium]